MKKYITLIMVSSLFLSLSSCRNDKLDDTSIFQDSSTTEKNDFDNWISQNYTSPYNIDLKYHMEDIETDHKFTLAPADFNKSIELAHIVRYAWLQAYDEVAGIDFTRQYVPKILQFIGSPAYENNGTMILGTAEGGLKVTLYMVNNLKIDADFLNLYYFKTMHHEFTHILNQTKAYDTDFNRITESAYISGDWYLKSDKEALTAGFITPYSMSEPREDFAEMTSIYITKTAAEWDALMTTAGTTGKALIDQKLKIVKNYFINSWGINLDELRDVVQRRMTEVVENKIDLSSLK